MHPATKNVDIWRYVSHQCPQSHKPLNLYISHPLLLMFCVILQQCLKRKMSCYTHITLNFLYFPRESILVTSAWTDHSIKTTQTSDILLASSAHNEFPFPRSHFLTERLAGGKKNPTKTKPKTFRVTFHCKQ